MNQVVSRSSTKCWLIIIFCVKHLYSNILMFWFRLIIYDRNRDSRVRQSMGFRVWWKKFNLLTTPSFFYNSNTGWMHKNWNHVVHDKPALATNLCTSMIDSVMMGPATSVHDFGIFIEVDLMIRVHARQTKPWCFTVLRQLRTIRHLVLSAIYQADVLIL